MNKITIATDFSSTPAGRYKTDGEFSGQTFRENYLVPALKKASNDNPLTVNITGAEGYGSNFLEEAFGGLIREEGFSCHFLLCTLKIESDSVYAIYEEQIWQYIKDAHIVWLRNSDVE